MALTNQLGLSLATKQTNTQNSNAAASNAAATKQTAPTQNTTTTQKSSSGSSGSWAWTSVNYQTWQTFQNATQWPYTLENAVSNWYDANAAAKAMQAKAEAQRTKVAVPVANNKVNWTTVSSKTSNVSTNSQFNVPSKWWIVSSTPTSLEARLEAAKAKYGAADSRVQKIQQLMDLKKSRANNSTWKSLDNTDKSTLTSDQDTSGAKKTKDELQLDPRTDNLVNDAIDTAADKNNQKSDVITDANDKVEKDTTEYKDKYEAEFESYKKQLEEREARIKSLEDEQRSKIEAWNKEQNDALSNRQMWNQAEATQKLGKLGASDTVLSNAQNEIRNNPVYQEQRAALQKQYIDTLSDTTKEYQTMYDNIMKNKTWITESKRALAEQLLGKINENTEKISTIKQAWIDDMFKPVETFQDKRIEDSRNSELSAKQNSEAQYRWAWMDESARIAKLKDALYNYDSTISRASLTPADYEKAAKEWDITKAVAILASTARNLTRWTTSSGSSTQKSSWTYTSIAQKFISWWVNTVDWLTSALNAYPNITDEQKNWIISAFKEQLWWKAPLKAWVTQYENNAVVDAYKKTNNIQ